MLELFRKDQFIELVNKINQEESKLYTELHIESIKINNYEIVKPKNQALIIFNTDTSVNPTDLDNDEAFEAYEEINKKIEEQHLKED